MTKVWDPLVRISHWLLVLFFFLAYLLEVDGSKMHAHAGYTVGLLVLFRFLWGIIGYGFARFSDFIAPPRQTLNYLRLLGARKAKRFVGHNPAGGSMIVVLLASLLLTTFTGICLFAMEGSGPLANTVVAQWPGLLFEEAHEFLANFTLFLIILHIAGVVFSSRLHNENLAMAMFTGRKRRE